MTDIKLIGDHVICSINKDKIKVPLERIKRFSEYNMPIEISKMDMRIQLTAKYIEDGKYDHVFLKNKYFCSYEKVYDRML